MEDLPCAIFQLKEASRQTSLRALYGGCQIYSSLGAAYMELGMFKEAKTTFMAVLERCDCSNHPDPKHWLKRTLYSDLLLQMH